MPWPQTPDERYATDQTFRGLVDFLHAYLEQDGCRNWTPSDLRAAAMLASAMYEAKKIKPLFIMDKNAVKFGREWNDVYRKPLAICSECGRSTYATVDVGFSCLMVLLDGSRCQGIFNVIPA